MKKALTYLSIIIFVGAFIYFRLAPENSCYKNLSEKQEHESSKETT